jgi:hypothetical protein
MVNAAQVIIVAVNGSLIIATAIAAALLFVN